METMRAAIDEVVTEHTTRSKVTVAMRQQECFAVRPGIDGLLDVARTTYLACIEEIHALAQRYGEEYKIPGLRVRYTASRGYHLTVPRSVRALPEEFCQAVRGRKHIAVSTQDLISLNDRSVEALTEIYVMTISVLQSLQERLRAHLPALHALVDGVALLDMLLSFANVVTLNAGWVRPRLTHAGPTVIKGGRHAIVEALFPGSFVANDTYFSTRSNLQLVTGPNASGKSTYLRQLALIHVLAQVGSYVPAEFASLRLCDRLLSRLSNEDDADGSSSTFLAEMRATRYILASATSRSLVLIDELGRGTSTLDGTAIAWAVAEKLAGLQAYSMLVTHFHQLTRLALLYPSISCLQLGTVVREESRLTFTYRVQPGGTSADAGYGISMAKHAGFPDAVLDSARQLRVKLAAATCDGDDAEFARQLAESSRRQALCQALRQLRDSRLEGAALVDYLAALAGKYGAAT
eukprot:PLAT8434.1.p1 GENE.PLAT8434.1~~PLAT8434.1.p1  ORF type:complete len:508 (+),score=190.01 PLAT8434.1:135-1526(+)